MADLVEARPARPLGPGDQGRVLELEEFEAAEFEPGFRYELVDGKLEVSPEPDLPHDEPLDALDALLREYRAQHHQAFDHLSLRARVFPPGGRQSVGPDLALFQGHRPFTGQRWQDLSPVLVVEVLSSGHEDKDLVRNRRLYAAVESIREYWIVDPRRGWSRLSLRVLRRDASGWSEQVLLQGARYETPLFPGLIVDLSRSDLGLSALQAVPLDRAREEGRQEGLNGMRRVVRAALQTRLTILSLGLEGAIAACDDLARLEQVAQLAVNPGVSGDALASRALQLLGQV